MTLVGPLIALIGIGVVGIGIAFAIFGGDRYRAGHPPAGAQPGMHPTSEIFIDPVTGRRQRVWGNPATGEREYRDE